MPTRHRRIAVVVDLELEAALETAQSFFPGAPAASLVRGLAIRGADDLAREEAVQDEAVERLIARSTSPDGFDRDALARAKDEAWGL